MVSRPSLENEISAGLAELRDLVADKATWSVAGWCSSCQISNASGTNEERFTSPAKQIPFLLGFYTNASWPHIATSWEVPAKNEALLLPGARAIQ